MSHLPPLTLNTAYCTTVERPGGGCAIADVMPSAHDGYWFYAVGLVPENHYAYGRRPVLAAALGEALAQAGLPAGPTRWSAEEAAPATRNPFEADRRKGQARCVYFVQAEAGGPIKIGVADDPRRRLRTLQTMSPVPLRLLAVMPGGAQEETGFHQRFADWRLHGEWFDERCPGLRALIESRPS